MNLFILTNFVCVFNDILLVMHEAFKRVGISLCYWLCGVQEDKGAGMWT